MSTLSKQFEGTVSKTPPGDIADNSECKYSPGSLVQGNFFIALWLVHTQKAASFAYVHLSSHQSEVGSC